MACTIAVQEIISEQNRKQADILVEDEGDLHAIVERFWDEELKHLDITVYDDQREAIHYKLSHTVIQSRCRVAIKIAKSVQAISSSSWCSSASQ